MDSVSVVAYMSEAGLPPKDGTMKKMIRLAGASILGLLLATTTAGAKDNNKEKENGGKHFGHEKNLVISVPEPATLGLLGAGVLAVGVTSLLRRRKK